MHIREATIDDTEALALLSGQLGYAAGASMIAKRLGGIAAYPAGVVLVAESDDGVAVGWAEVSLQRHLVHDTRAEIAGLIVADDTRGQGIGVALLRAVEAWSREQGVAELVVRSNVVRERAHRFYLREGYAEEKRQAVFTRRL